MAKKKKKATESVTELDIRWARKHGWLWVGDGFIPEPQIKVIANPMEHVAPGWTPWLAPIGALQMDAPFGSVRAALRVAEHLRRGHPLPDGEMSCAEEA